MYGYNNQPPYQQQQQYVQPQQQYMQPQLGQQYMQPGAYQPQPNYQPQMMMHGSSSSSSAASTVAMNAGMTRPPPNFSPYAPGYTPANPNAFTLFQNVDHDRSGYIDIKELHHALSNGGWTKFSPKTTRLLMKMFDLDRSGTFFILRRNTENIVYL